jgi:rare lipoprotein A (peptidoglycan hydrolase)
MTRDRIVEVSKKAAERAAKTESGTAAKKKYVQRLAELKAKRAIIRGRGAAQEEGRLRAYA